MPSLAQRLQGDIKSDLVPVLETVGNSLGHAGDTDGHTIDDVFLSRDIRYVRESMFQVARNGGFLAVVGESGAGKTTLREELIDRIRREEQAIITVEPYVQAMEGSEKNGKTLRSLHRIAEERLQQYHLTHVQQVDRLIGQFREVLTVLQAPLPSDERLAQVDETLEGDPASWIVQCDEHMAFAGNNYYPFMLQPYRSKRSLLFQCLDVLALKSSSQDDALLQAVDWLQRHRNSHREYLTLGADEFAEMALEGLPEKWRKLIFAKGDTAKLEASLLTDPFLAKRKPKWAI